MTQASSARFPHRIAHFSLRQWVGYFILDDHGRISEWSDGLERFARVAAGDLLGKAFLQAETLADSEEFKQLIDLTRPLLALPPDHLVRQTQNRQIESANRPASLISVVYAAIHSSAEEVLGSIGVVISQPINGSHRQGDPAEKGSPTVERTDQPLLAALVVHIPVGRIVSANSFAAQIFGYSQASFLNLASQELLVPSDRAEIDPNLLNQHSAGEWFSFNAVWKHKDRGEIAVAASGIPFTLAGSDYAFLLLEELPMEMEDPDEENDELRLTEAMRDVTQSLTSTLDLDEVLGRVLNNLSKVVHYVTANVMFIAEGKTYIASGRGYTSEPLVQWQRNWNAPLDEFPILMRMANTLQPVVYADTYEERSWIRLPETDWIRSYVGAPIIRGGQIYGFINVNSDQPGDYDEDTARHLMTFAEQASIALENARLFEETRLRAKRLGLLNEIASSINEPTNLQDILIRSAHGLAIVMEVEQTGIALLSSDGRYLEVLAEHSGEGSPDAVGDRIPIQDNPSLAYIFANKKSLAILNAQSDPMLANIHGLMRDRNVKSILLVPIIIKGQVIGTVGCDAIREPRAFTPEDISLAETMAGLIALRIEQTRLLESVRQQAGELEQVRRILHKINASAHIASVLDEIGLLLKEFTGAQRISIGLLSDERDQFILFSPDEKVSGLVDRSLYPVEITAAAKDVLAGHIHRTADLSSESDFAAEKRLLEAGFRSRINFPLITAFGVIGTLNIVWEKTDGYSGLNLVLMEQVAEAVALAVERGNLLEQTRNRDAILEVLGFAAEELLQASELDQIAPSLLEQLGQVMHVSRAYIFANETLPTGRLAMSERFGWVAEDAPVASNSSRRQELEYEALGLQRWEKRLSKREPIFGLAREFPAEERRFLEQEAVKSLAIVPIFVRGTWWGFFGFDDCQRERLWLKVELEALKSLGETLGGAMARIQSEKAEREQLQLAEALRQVAMVLTATTKIENVLNHILENVSNVIKYDAANIMLLKGGYLYIAAALGYIQAGFNNPREEFPRPLTEFPNFVQLAQGNEAMIIADTDLDPEWVEFPAVSGIKSFLGAPIRFHNQTIGFINLDSRQAGFFAEADAVKLMAFANQAAIAIENTRLFEETHDRAMQMSLLNKITQFAISANSAEEVIQTLTEQITDLLSGSKSYLALWDPETNKPGKITSTENLFARVEDPDIVAEVSLLTEQAIKRGHVQVIEDLQNTNLLRSSAMQRAGGVTVLVLPLISNQQKHGSMVVVYNSRQVIDLNLLSLGEQAAGQIALAISKTRLLETETIKSHTLERINTILTALSHVSVQLETARDPDEVLQTLGQELRALKINCVVWMADPDRQAIHFRYASLDPAEIRRVERVFGEKLSSLEMKRDEFAHFEEVILSGKPIFLEDFRQEMPRVFPRLSIRIFDLIAGILDLSDRVSGFFLPLLAEDKVIGTIWMLASEFTQHDQSAAVIFAGQVAMSLENARLYKHVQQLAITDDLTGLYNRRGLMELGQREFDRARRFNRSLFAVMFDLDDFRNVNNTYGHAIGDEVLRELARRCEAVLRSTDVLGRYGGEEFCALISESDLSGAIEIAERLRLNVAATPFRTRRADLKVTISLGVAAMDRSCEDLMELIDLADRGLYRAKRGGKNRVSLESADDVPPQGFENNH